MLHRATLSLLVIACVAFLSPNGNSQNLDGLWFKLTAKVKGRALEWDGKGTDVMESKAKGTVVGYMLVQDITDLPEAGEPPIPGAVYVGNVLCEVDSNWTLVDTAFFRTIGADESVMTGPGFPEDVGITLHLALDGGESEEGEEKVGEGSNYLRFIFTARSSIKTSKDGDVTKASFKSFAAAVPSGQVDDSYLVGGAKLSGKSVDPSKLPFDPSLL
jgi:hypothetical protein